MNIELMTLDTLKELLWDLKDRSDPPLNFIKALEIAIAGMNKTTATSVFVNQYMLPENGDA